MDIIQPEKVVDLLNQEGLEISIEQGKIVQFLQTLAEICVAQYLKCNEFDV